jgi:hypothetical protein
MTARFATVKQDKNFISAAAVAWSSRVTGEAVLGKRAVSVTFSLAICLSSDMQLCLQAEHPVCFCSQGVTFTNRCRGTGCTPFPTELGFYAPYFHKRIILSDYYGVPFPSARL